MSGHVMRTRGGMGSGLAEEDGIEDVATTGENVIAAEGRSIMEEDMAVVRSLTAVGEEA